MELNLRKLKFVIYRKRVLTLPSEWSCEVTCHTPYKSTLCISSLRHVFSPSWPITSSVPGGGSIMPPWILIMSAQQDPKQCLQQRDTQHLMRTQDGDITRSEMLGRFWVKMRFKQRSGGRMEGEGCQMKGRACGVCEGQEKDRGAEAPCPGKGRGYSVGRSQEVVLGVLLSKGQGKLLQCLFLGWRGLFEPPTCSQSEAQVTWTCAWDLSPLPAEPDALCG